MLDKATQKKKLLRHMLDIGPITKAEAHKLYFIENVGQRVAELREDGYNIPNPARMVKLVEGGARVAMYEVVNDRVVFKQRGTLCECMQSYYTKNGKCTRCQRTR